VSHIPQFEDVDVSAGMRISEGDGASRPGDLLASPNFGICDTTQYASKSSKSTSSGSSIFEEWERKQNALYPICFDIRITNLILFHTNSNRSIRFKGVQLHHSDQL